MFGKVKALVLEDDIKAKKISDATDVIIQDNTNQIERDTVPTIKIAGRIRKVNDT
jgi:hypothetical protein